MASGWSTMVSEPTGGGIPFLQKGSIAATTCLSSGDESGNKKSIATSTTTTTKANMATEPSISAIKKKRSFNCLRRVLLFQLSRDVIHIVLDTCQYQYRGVTDKNYDQVIFCSEFADEVSLYHREREHHQHRQKQRRKNVEGWSRFGNLNMRAILVDWLQDLHHNLNFERPSRYLMISLLDKFLATSTGKLIHQSEVQLCGVTALWIATKFEDTKCACLEDLISACQEKAGVSLDDTPQYIPLYCDFEFVDIEYKMLTALDWEIYIPTSFTFLLRFQNIAGRGNFKLFKIATEILDATLRHRDLVDTYLPSQLAAACILLARRIHGRTNWNSTLPKYTFYKEEEILPISEAMIAKGKYLFKSMEA